MRVGDAIENSLQHLRGKLQLLSSERYLTCVCQSFSLPYFNYNKMTREECLLMIYLSNNYRRLLGFLCPIKCRNSKELSLQHSLTLNGSGGRKTSWCVCVCAYEKQRDSMCVRVCVRLFASSSLFLPRVVCVPTNSFRSRFPLPNKSILSISARAYTRVRVV